MLIRAGAKQGPGKILKDEDTVGSYNIEEKGFIVCMVSKVIFSVMECQPFAV
jgi:hypothetical protein